MKTTLQWPKHPSRTQHPILGLRLRLTDRSKRYRIERFPEDGDPTFIVAVFVDAHWRPLAHKRKLKAAKLYCYTHYRETTRKTHVRRG